MLAKPKTIIAAIETVVTTEPESETESDIETWQKEQKEQLKKLWKALREAVNVG